VSPLALVVALIRWRIELGTFYAAGSAFVGALVALFIYHAAVARPALQRTNRLLELHGNLLSGDTRSAANRLGALEDSHTSARTALQDLSNRLAALEALAATDLSRVGFVRYDAFTGSGSGLSYALALLNRQGDGVVLNSIYSRDDARTFGKPVEAFEPKVRASAEELEAIERARLAAS
jgi:hypothetical protein